MPSGLAIAHVVDRDVTAEPRGVSSAHWFRVIGLRFGSVACANLQHLELRRADWVVGATSQPASARALDSESAEERPGASDPTTTRLARALAPRRLHPLVARRRDAAARGLECCGCDRPALPEVREHALTERTWEGNAARVEAIADRYRV